MYGSEFSCSNVNGSSMLSYAPSCYRVPDACYLLPCPDCTHSTIARRRRGRQARHGNLSGAQFVVFAQIPIPRGAAPRRATEQPSRW
jgi:hypothetical protein